MPASTSLLPNFEVLINGAPLEEDILAYVAEVVVDTSVELPGMFTIELSGSDQLKDEHEWIDDQKLFAIGNAVEIKFMHNKKKATLIKGEITALEPEFSSHSLPGLTVRGYDRRHRLQRGRKTRSFAQRKDSDIAAQMAREAGLTDQTTDSKVTHDYVLQANQTDLEFLQERARKIEYEVVVEEKTLLFRPVANAKKEVLTLSFEDDLLEFSPRLTAVGQVSEVEVRSWSAKDKKEIVGKAKIGAEVSTMGGQKSGGELAESAFGAAPDVVTSSPALTQAEADQMATARFNHLSLGLIIGEGLCMGRPDLLAGKVIKLEGIGKRFSGLYYVTAARHRCLSQRGYQTYFSVRRNAS